MENVNPTPGDSKTDDNDNASVASDSAMSEKAASVKSSASGIPKPSGIRPPSSTGGTSGVSRIGRPCLGQQKPGLPQMTAVKNGSDDINVRRLTDDYGRHKLTDVQEENEDETAANTMTTTRRNRYSSIGSTASSMDYLWDLNPRRLSEAGLSRHSDNSTILTEDTDSFIIGQRVWVGGTKPGSIAYIGETQFAPGDWAGIVLDQPIGKNDGSVGGIRYFQCEPKKGVFSRLTRLTRYPLGDTDGSVADIITSTPVNGRNSASPSGSLSPLKSPPSLTTSNTSLASMHVDFKLGDRVIIKSSQGSKIGTLRFMGSTDFAAGEWCGVELDEPRGKNDGSVGGKRYFDCRPNFGLFAPVAKVSRSPSNRKPGSCVVHSGPGLPPSGFRRANSKESLASNTSITSAASGVRRVRLGVTSLTTPQRASPKTPAAPLPTRTALQEVLKEKQQHIEQLLRERDLERAEIAKAASQADEAEQRYVDLKQEFDLYRLDAERKLLDHVSLLTQLKNEMKELLSHLEDEKRKNEDLQFRFEEAAITKADLEQKNSALSVSNDTHLAQISELENQLSQERQRVETLETESNKLFETEESLVRVKEENEALKYEIEVAAKKIQLLESEDSSNKDLASSHAKELEDLQMVLKQKDDVIEKIKTDVKSISEQYEQSRINFTKEIEDYKAKILTSNNESNELKNVVESLKSELDQAKLEIVEKSGLLSKITEDAKEVEGRLNKEMDKLKMSLSSKNLDVENLQEGIKSKDGEIKELTSQIASLKTSIENQSGDVTKFKDNAKEIEETLRKELDESRSTIKAKINEIEQVKKELAVAVTEKETGLKEAEKAIKNHVEDIEKLKQTLTEIKEANSKNLEELQGSRDQQIKDLETKNADLNKLVQDKEETFAKASLELSKLKNDLESRNLEFGNIQTELDRTKNKLAEETALLTKANEDVNQLRLNSNDLERKLKSSEEKSNEILQQKTRLEEEVRNLVGSSGDYSNRLDEMSRELQEKDKNMANMKNDLTLRLQDMEKLKEEIELNYNTYVNKSEKDLKEREETIHSLTAAKDGMKKELDRTILENQNNIDALNVKINEIQTALNEKEDLLKKLEGDSKSDQEKSQSFLEKVSEEYKVNLENLQKKIEDLSKEHQEINEKLSKKSIELIEMESKYNSEVELSKQAQHELKMNHEEKIKQLEQQLVEKDKEKSSLNESSKNEFDQKIREMQNQNDEVKKGLEERITNLTKQIDEYESKINSATAEKTKIAEDFDKSQLQNQTALNEMSSKIINLEEELKSKDLALQKLQEESTENENKLKMDLAKFSGDFQSNSTQYQNQIEALHKEKIDIEKALADKESEIEKAKVKQEELVQKAKEENQNLTAKFEEDKKKFSEELSKLSEDINNKEIEIENMKQAHKNSELTTGDKEKEIEQLKAELQINHSFIDRLQGEKKELSQQKESLANAGLEKDKQFEELNKKLGELSVQLENTNQVSHDLQTATNLYVTILQLLQLNEEQKIGLVDRLEGQVKKECDTESYTKLCKVVDGIRVTGDDPKGERIKALEQEIETYKKKQSELEARLKKQVSQIPQPALKNQDNHKTDKGSKLDNGNAPIIINNNPPSVTTNEQLMEEKLLAESQVAFLNAIIVDMQKKNEEQKTRIEILESGYSPAAVEELGLLRLSDRNLPPRMYCDICEEFDLHETEDCPQQANDDLPAREKSPKEKPQPRPYCELCEMFGHATEDCQEDQTF